MAAPSTTNKPWILLGRRDKKVAAFVEETAPTTPVAHRRRSRAPKRAAQPPAERLRGPTALAALCGRPRAPPRAAVASAIAGRQEEAPPAQAQALRRPAAERVAHAPARP